MENLPLIDALYREGWVVCPGYLAPAQVSALAHLTREQAAAGVLKPARIGHRDSEQLNPTVRGDAIAWLDEADARGPVAEVLHAFDTLRREVNRELMLGLHEFEGHLAVYPPGAGYRRHLDQFRDADTRRLTAVLYVNDAPWQDADGGHLRLYLDGEAEQPYLDVRPDGGTLVLFLSGRFYHEVLPTQRERLSLTGWFRVRE